MVGATFGARLADADEVLQSQQRHGPIEDTGVDARKPFEASEVAAVVSGRAQAAQDRPRLVGGQVVVCKRPVEGVALRPPQHVVAARPSPVGVEPAAVSATG